MFDFSYFYLGKYFDFTLDTSFWAAGISINLIPLSLTIELLFMEFSVHWKDDLAPGRVD